MESRAIKGGLLVFFCCFANISFSVGYAESKEIEQDESIVMNKVMEWSDSAFYFHEDYRFEGFRAHYTEDFKVVMLRSDQYKQKIENLKESRKNKTYTGSDQGYDRELNTLERKYRKFQIIVDSFSIRVKYYEILFWSNIRTNHGYSVYYAHRFKLSNDYFIMAAFIKSSIGNKRPDNKIIYN
jgi:hypothetical protein